MYRDLLIEAAQIPAPRWAELEAAAKQVTSLSILPVVGAGASRACETPLASELAKNLHAKVKDSTLPLVNPPSDFDTVPVRKDLGKVADALYLEYGARQIVEAVGFDDTAQWPSPEQVFGRFDHAPHSCSYRILARLAKESFLTEAVSFNYDCHFEGGLLKEGFFSSASRPAGRWPERFSVIANAEQNADVSRRGEFTLNKVHGCVQTWRESGDRDEASKTIVIRWSQLLDWRDDRWARDLFKDRARRHVLFLLGFSGMDPVIHSTLQAVMKELSRDERLEGPSRVRILDVNPTTLTLKMLADSGRGTIDDNRYFKVSNLAATILGLYVLLVRNRLDEYARSYARPLALPTVRIELLRRISMTGPAMLRWTWNVLGSTQTARGLRGLRERRDDYYVPLSASPGRTLTAFELRDELAAMHGVSAEADTLADVGAFLTVPRAGKAFMPLGLYPHEANQLAVGGALTHLPVALRSPVGGLDRVVVARDETRALRAFSLETGNEVGI